MTTRINNIRKDNIRFLKYFYFYRRLIVISIVLVPIAILLSYNLSYNSDDFWVHFILTFLTFLLLLILVVFGLPFLISFYKVNKSMRLALSGEETGTLEIKPLGINIVISNVAKFYKWQNIKFIGKYENNIYIILYDKNFYLLSNDAFRSQNDADYFFNNVRDEILKCQPNNPRRMYPKGWLGLIPLIGAFVGVWLIILGASKYKDKKLIGIGFVAVLFTVAVYSSMIYYFEYSKQFRKDFAIFSQPYMNTLIKSIEFYKTQHGSYPDSLEQLVIDDKTITIHDPILSEKPIVNKQQFYYGKIGSKYFLFSCGVDKIPYTNDDIFPSLNLFDSTKTGLIRAVRK